MVDWTSRVWLRYEDEGIRGSQCSNDYIVELRLELMSRVLLTVADPSPIISGVLGGIRGYTPYTNLRVFFDSVYSPQ